MWKDFFNFSKRERITMVALTLLIILVQVMIWTKDFWVKFLPDEVEQKYHQKKALEAYRDSMTATKPTYASKPRSDKKFVRTEPLILVPFDPNTADSLTLRRLGLRSYVVKNILNYRRKGGVFRKPSDFSRIYGLDPDVFASLEHLIQLEGKTTTAIPSRSTSLKAPDPPVVKSEPPSVGSASNRDESSSNNSAGTQTNTNLVFDLNSADTTMLQQLKGVGSFTANRIARYRNQLGGFYSMSQLSEIKGLYPETLTRLQSMLKIDPSHINTLNVNKVSLEKLRAHPYLSFYQAKVIVELRKARGSLHSLDDLSKFEEFKPEDLERLKWYLSF
jgi:DNA uptake protein ComE-like DNA-binding protein